jgi:alpha-tubulin suppressor-like RCC1 family protein
VRSELRRSVRVSGSAWIALLVLACSCSDTSVSCSPTLTCEVRPNRFKPRDNGFQEMDGGYEPCGPLKKSCRALTIAAGGRHGCATAQGAELYCWGDNDEQQRGDAAAVLNEGYQDYPGGAPKPDRDAGGPTFTLVARGVSKVVAGSAHTCMLQQGRVSCWGRNAEGQVVGQPSLGSVSFQLQASELASDLDAGDAHTCMVTDQGVICWGDASHGQCGRQVMLGALPPALVPGTQGAVEVATGSHHTCARFGDGHVACWGELIDAASSQLHATPEVTPVFGLDDASAITAGAGHTCAIHGTGEVVCWGLNSSGQLGSGTRTSSAIPVPLMSSLRAVRIAAGGGQLNGELFGHTCVVDTSLQVQCWGRNTEGQLGIGQSMLDGALTPQVVLGAPGESDEPHLGNIVEIAAGAFFTCALDHDGPVLCWGDDTYGQLGGSSTPDVGRLIRVERFDG